jgi:hypothetical protein
MTPAEYRINRRRLAAALAPVLAPYVASNKVAMKLANQMAADVLQPSAPAASS